MNIVIQETIVNPLLQVDDSTNQVIISISEVINNVDIQVNEVAIPGQTGKSLYDLAVQTGFAGTIQEYLETQKNVDGGLIF